jgi:hypothetical protein
MKIAITMSIISSILGKSIEDPVARHDANQCGTYLCASMPSYTTEYLQSGCIGEFQEYVKEKVSFEKVGSILYEKDSIETTEDLSYLFFLSTGVLSASLGYFYGKYEDVKREEEEFELK